MIFFPKKFKEVRQRQGMTLKEVAEKIGVAESSVHSWECGKNTPRAARIHKLAELFRCSEEEFADFEPGEYVPKRLTVEALALKGVSVPGVPVDPNKILESFRLRLLEAVIGLDIPADALQIVLKTIKETKP